MATHREGERASSYVPPGPRSPTTATEGRRAGGGPVSAYGAYTFQENGQPEVLQMGSMGGFVFPSVQSWAGAMGGGGPLVVENHIEVGGEVVRVVRTEISAHDRNTKRRVTAGAGAR